MNELQEKIDRLHEKLSLAKIGCEIIQADLNKYKNLHQPNNSELLSDIGTYVSTKKRLITKDHYNYLNIIGERIYYGPCGNILEISLNDGVYLSEEQRELVKSYYSDINNLDATIFRN